MDAMKRSEQSDDYVFIPKNFRNVHRGERLDLPTKIKNTIKSFETGLSCLDPADKWELQKVREVINRAIERFLTSFKREVGLLKDSQIESYEKAAKDRFKNLGIMMHKLQTAEPGDIMIYVFGGNNVIEIPNIRYLKKGSELLFIKDNDEFEEILEFDKEPKLYSILYRAMISVLGEFYLPIKIAQPKKALVVLQMAQFLLTAGNIFTALRSPKCLADKREKEIFLSLQVPSVDLPRGFVEEFELFKSELEEGKLPYIREFSRALRAVTEGSLKFVDSDYYGSTKSSTSYSEDFGRLPAALASAFEIDVIKELSIEFDEITGYTSSYKEESPGCETLAGKTLTIEQNQLKLRAIHAFCNAVQDRMNLIERVLSGVTQKLPSDCTKNQRLGVQAAMLWTSRIYRESKDNPTIACMDLSNATDNLNPEFQRLVLELILPKPMVDWWMRIASLTKQFQFKSFKNLNYDQVKGQPQGLLSSFSAFALAHHVVMLLMMRRAGLVHNLASQVYRILGDDCIINSVNGGINGNIIVQKYTSIASIVGWEVDLNKSHITYFEDDYAFGEFAKVTVLDGVMVTPPPFRLLSQIVGHSDRGAREFAFCIWLSKHGYAETEVLDACIGRWAEGDRLVVLNTLMKGGIIPFLEEFRDHTILDDSEMWKITAIEYLKSVIRESIVDSVLNDREKDSLDFMETYVKKTSVKTGKYKGLSEIALLDKLTTDLPSGHKLWYFLQRNAHIEDAVKNITGLDSSRIVISSLDLTDDEISGILEIDSVIQLQSVGILDIDRVSLSDILRKLKSLERYRLKSMYKSIGRMTNSILVVVDNYFNLEATNIT